MEFAELKVEERNATGKSGARKLRASGMIPAIIYGDSSDSIPLSINEKTIKKILQDEGQNVIFKLTGLSKEKTAMIKDIQKNPIKDVLIHVDFKIITLDVAIEASVQVELTGDAAGVKEGGVLQQSLREITIKALPGNIPEKIQFDITDFNVGDAVKVSDLPVLDGVEYIRGEEEQIASIVPPTKEEEVVPVAEGEEGEEAEGEAEEGTEGAAEEKPGAGKEEATKETNE